MILWPRTLLWRSVLLIAALLVVAHLAWLQIFRASEVEPRALQAAQQVVSVVNLTRAALVTADPGRRYALLDELAAVSDKDEESSLSSTEKSAQIALKILPLVSDNEKLANILVTNIEDDLALTLRVFSKWMAATQAGEAEGSQS